MYKKKNLNLDIETCNDNSNKNEIDSYYEIKNLNLIREFLGIIYLK